MEKQQVEFSLSYFLKYAITYILIAVFCAGIGLGLGAYVAAAQEVVHPKKYTGVLRIDAPYYVEAMNGIVITDAEYAFYTRKVTQVIETAKAPEVSTKTFLAHKDALYGSLQSEAERVDAFNGDISITLTTDALSVSFVHDADTDAKRAEAMAVVNDYLANAKANILEKHPEFQQEAIAASITVTSAQEDVIFKEGLQQMSEGPSVLLYALIGAFVGAILGAGVIFAMYLLDPRVKTMTELVPEANANVVDADSAAGVANLAALIKASGAKSLALGAPVQDAAFARWAEQLVAYLTAAGVQVKQQRFEAGNPSWLGYFDKEQEQADIALYLCDNTELGVLSYVSKNTEATALFVDHKAVKLSTLRAALDAVRGCSYIGTVMHNKGRSYLD